ncbi:M23 family metallopeptidase [Thermaerobacillus caldiproteolyticus]|uniref:M23 family metallopeptidase n=1 Tax=Thermaerobacillus caldiproteolyticus TaxID=247480 RepID=UPI0018F1E632|nr:M23 family metallopeptidase [Anoxybacillus caldiproteolyticus]
MFRCSVFFPLSLLSFLEQPVAASDFTCQPYTGPAEGIITSGYGPRSDGFHYGIDIAKSGDVPVRAAYAGIVSRAQWMNGYGNVVMIQHRGRTAETVYAHLKSYSVKVGDVVSPGQQIGIMGSTGDATGQHLHFEIHLGLWNNSRSNATDPIPLLPDETTSSICWNGDLMKKG